jgi:2-polyprenyl-6-methoxyphenol hydroxylase-like FAD-dependent oxidoreductase
MSPFYSFATGFKMAHISSPVPGFLVVVAGGGMVGLAAALAVHRLGRGRIDVTILDPNFAQRILPKGRLMMHGLRP